MPADNFVNGLAGDNAERIRQHLGFVRCDAPQRERLLNHLTAIAQGLTRATALRQAAHRWLKQEQIVLPGHTTLRDVIVSARPVIQYIRENFRPVANVRGNVLMVRR